MKQETLEEKLNKIVSKEPSKFWKESDERFKNKETLEEVAEIWVHNRFTKQIKDEDIYASESSIVQSHILFAKWQQERSYSEEEVLEFTQTMIMQYKFGNTNIEQMDLLKETLQLFKKK
jgi:hypothetical protein